MSTITYLLLDADNDPVFDPLAALADLAAVTQAIRTRLLLFEGEWWADLNDGTPMFQEIIGKRATPNGLQTMALALNARVSGTPYVSGVQDVETTFSNASRLFTYSAVVQTSFGQAVVGPISPGSTASLG